jgi:hypothetical protein
MASRRLACIGTLVQQRLYNPGIYRFGGLGKNTELADRLCADGVNALIDQYMSAPPTGWLHWVGEQLEVADFVLMICTRTYSENLSDNSTTETNKEERAIGDLVRRHLFDGRCNGPQ